MLRDHRVAAATALVAVIFPAVVAGAGATATWTTKAPLLEGRYSAAAAPVAGQLYLAGGALPGGSASDSLFVYDPATDGWTPRAPMPLTVGEAEAAELGGKLYVVGGWLFSDSSFPTGALSIYDPDVDSWTSGESMPTPRGATAVAAVGGKLYVTGGEGPCCLGQHDELDIYDPATDGWTSGAPLPVKVAGAVGAALDGKFYVIGGYMLVPGPAHVVTDLVQVYDPATNEWTTAASLPAARGLAAGAVVDGRIHVVGGAATVPLATHEVYDPTDDSWSTAAPLPAARAQLAAAGIGPTLFAVGGSVGNDLYAYEQLADELPPEITCTAPDASVWYAADVSVSCTASDDDSGLADPADASFSLVTSVPAESETSSASAGSRSVSDNAGNTSVAGPYSFMVDKKRPNVSCDGVASFLLNEPDAVVTAVVSDGGSGPAAPGASAAADTSTVGWKLAFPTAYDAVGNAGSAACAYQVSYAFGGFAGQVAPSPAVNTGRSGRTYPLRWQLTDADGASIRSLDAVTGLTVKATSCAAFTSDPAGATAAAASGGTRLRYDSAGSQYVFNWATPGPGCYTLFLHLSSGQLISARFALS